MLVKLLLDDNRENRVLPDANNSMALKLAAENGHVDVVSATR